MKGGIALRKWVGDEEGTAYRSPREIREDIRAVSERVARMREGLDFREILGQMLAEYADAAPSSWIPALEAAVAEAEESLRTLGQLEQTLTALGQELADVRAAIFGSVD